MAKVHDGSDYKHRQKILPHYQLTALTKKRLRFTVILHLLLAFGMVIKLLPAVLDHLNIFWQPIEELRIPGARTWEWVWFSSALTVTLGLRASRTNNLLGLKIFLLGVIATCIFPIIYCAYDYSTDFRTFVITKDASKTSETWRDYPVALYWYIFIGVACQIHGFEIYFAWELIKNMSAHRAVNKNK